MNGIAPGAEKRVADRIVCGRRRRAGNQVTGGRGWLAGLPEVGWQAEGLAGVFRVAMGGYWPLSETRKTSFCAAGYSC
jgi:hypothetical protein